MFHLSNFVVHIVIRLLFRTHGRLRKGRSNASSEMQHLAWTTRDFVKVTTSRRTKFFKTRHNILSNFSIPIPHSRTVILGHIHKFEHPLLIKLRVHLLQRLHPNRGFRDGSTEWRAINKQDFLQIRESFDGDFCFGSDARLTRGEVASCMVS